MEKMSERYETLTEAEAQEWERIRLQSQIDELEKRAAEYLKNRKRK